MSINKRHYALAHNAGMRARSSVILMNDWKGVYTSIGKTHHGSAPSRAKRVLREVYEAARAAELTRLKGKRETLR